MVLNWYFVLIHFMAALFCYLLCRDLKRSRVASVVAGFLSLMINLGEKNPEPPQPPAQP